jgi:hypothetical protein
MSNFIFSTNTTVTLVCVPSGEAGRYSLEAVAVLTGVLPELIRYYRARGLLGPDDLGSDGEPWFDREALEEVRRLEHFRRRLGVGRRGLPLMRELWHEAARRHVDLRFLRDG